MTRRRPGPALLRCLTAVMLLAGGGPARGTERALLLDVFINAHPSGIVAEFHERAGQLFARRDELQTLGLQPGPGGAADEVPLGGWADLSWRLDERAQRLHVTVPPHLLRPSRLGPAGALEADRPALESAWGAVLNYDLIGTGLLGSGLGRPRAGSKGGPGHGLADRVLAQALLDGRMFSPFGVAATSYLGRADAGAAAFTRLESSWVFSEPDSMLRARAGDLVSSGLSWSRPVRLGGVQFSTDFAIRPDLVTFPTPTITGTVAVPSTVDVLVNGVRLLGQEVQPGPFEIRQLPVVTGAGEVSVVTRDASGQDVRRSLPIYASAAMLAPGLSSFSAEAGLVRLNYGLAGGDYRAPTGAVTYRRGLADWLTVEGHAETSLGHGAPRRRRRAGTLAMAGGGLATAVPRLGGRSLGVAGSTAGGRTGGLVSVAVERIGPALSAAVAVQASTPGFRDTAASFGDPYPRLRLRASLGWTLGRFGTFGLAYIGLRRDPAWIAAPQYRGAPSSFDLPSLVPATRVSLLSASLSRPLFDSRAYAWVNGYRDFGGSAGLVAGISVALGPRSTAGASLDMGRGQSYGGLQASHAAVANGDFGGQLQLLHGDLERELATGEYRTPWGRLAAGIDHAGRQTALRASAQGALALAGGSVFAANTLRDSFAVVDTGLPGVGVLHENRPVGRTGADGRLLVPDLRSFGRNRIGIAATDVPIDAEVGETTRLVRPQDRSGVVVRFPVRRNDGAIVRLTDAAGTPIPAGSSVRQLRPDAAAATPVGFDGEAYLTGLGARNRIEVRLANGRRCQAEVAYARQGGTLPRLQASPCRAVP